jgi:hypothetical protein
MENKILNSKEWRVESQNYKAKRGRKGRQAYNTLLLVLLEAVPVPPPPVVGTLRRLNKKVLQHFQQEHGALNKKNKGV